MDLLYSIIGGLVLGFIGTKLVKKVWLAALLAAIITIVVIGTLGWIGIDAIGAAIIAAIIGAYLGKARKKS